MRVLVTGANRGIGAALLDGYRSDGATVFGTTRAAGGADGLIAADVTRPGDLATLSATLGADPLDVLICNAGVYPDKVQALGTGYPAAMWADAFAVNVTGVFLTVQALLPQLRAARGRIAIISSQMASHTRAPGGSYVYRASKAAALNLGRNLATDLRGDGVSVGIYHPGWVRTDMGGGSAEIAVDEAAAGLKDRIAELSLDSTGCFRTWDGRDHPY
ncbi:SDR family NAD(P)-dependent oxidoreductase [Anianabacter salinae]|uniref:SDR family NAD(P)-dependent oxidoreductase n=1 Tax=Anianabacter salinae TaxID=2851023 RepID=UPI00225E65DE|nr:SDR family NAD(P)-dependent oxidoreductase [Anianabacter salinae]MBV0912664.1 SDR family NAD(P)-dependent oxidoreductase [Anianabacter salinae]